MTPEEARALFPVLERLAYLNAGTFGPLARPTAAAVQEQLDADLADGRFGKEYFERMLDLRKQASVALAGLVGAEPEQIALTGSTTDGCNIVLAGLDLQPEDEIVTTSEEHFGLHRPGARERRARRRRRPGSRRDPGRGDASDAAARALAGALDERPRCCPCASCESRRACRCWSTARSRSARSRSTPPVSTSSRSPARSGSAAPTRPAHSSSPIRSACASPARAISRSPPTSRREASSRPRARHGSIPAGSRAPSSPGCWPRSTSAPTGPTSVRPSDGRALPRAARAAGRGRAGRCDARRLPRRGSARRSSPAWPRRASSCARSRRPGLVRVSCGWWTNENDLHSRGSGRGLTATLAHARWSRSGTGGPVRRGRAPLALRPASRSSSASRRICRRRSLGCGHSGRRARRLRIQVHDALDARPDGDPGAEATKLSRAVGAVPVNSSSPSTGRAAPTLHRRSARDAYCLRRHRPRRVSRDPRRRDLEQPNKRLFSNPQRGRPLRTSAARPLLRRPCPLRERHRARALVDRQRRRGLHLAGGVHPRCRRLLPRARPTGRILDTSPTIPTRLTRRSGPGASTSREPIGLATGTSSCSTSSRFTARPADPGRSVRLWYTSRASRPRSMPAVRLLAAPRTAHRSPTRRGEPSPPPAETTDAPTSPPRPSTRFASRVPAIRAAYFNFLLADEPALSRWQSAPSGSTDAEGLLARLPAGDRSRYHRHRRLRCAQGACRAPTSCRRTYRPLRRRGRAAACRPLLERRHRRRRRSPTASSERRPRRHTSATSWSNVSSRRNHLHYAVRAIDAAGNLGDASASVT